MSGRIRTLKPEWLEDEKLCLASPEARVLSVALILLADDHGNGRAHPALLKSRALPLSSPDSFSAALAELLAMPFAVLYEADQQRYFHIVNWSRHQRVDKPGKPRVPGPPSGPATTAGPGAKVAYFIRGATTGLIKIGSSIDPVQRLADLSRAGSETLELLAVGGVEIDLHNALAQDRVHGEWFRPTEGVLAKVREHGGDPSRPMATAGYQGVARSMLTTGPIEVTADRSGAGPDVPGARAKIPGSLAPDPDPTTTSIPSSDRAPAHARDDTLSDADPSSRARGLLVRGYQARYEAARNDAWLSASAARTHIDDVAAWAARQSLLEKRPVDHVVTEYLDRVFANPFLAKHHWDWKLLARNPARDYRSNGERPAARGDSAASSPDDEITTYGDERDDWQTEFASLAEELEHGPSTERRREIEARQNVLAQLFQAWPHSKPRTEAAS